MEAEQSVAAPFPPEQPRHVCSENTCVNGHSWIPTVGVAKCPGCAAPVLAVRMENCPHCNEPCGQVRLRTDHLGWKGVIVALCKGFGSSADVGEIVMERDHWKVMEEKKIPVGYQPAIRRECGEETPDARTAEGG